MNKSTEALVGADGEAVFQHLLVLRPPENNARQQYQGHTYCRNRGDDTAQRDSSTWWVRNHKEPAMQLLDGNEEGNLLRVKVECRRYFTSN